LRNIYFFAIFLLKLSHNFLPDGLDPRGVTLASLYMRGHMVMVNYAAGWPVPTKDLLPGNHMDGRLFQTLYLR
jgi:hypothetical protein